MSWSCWGGGEKHTHTHRTQNSCWAHIIFVVWNREAEWVTPEPYGPVIFQVHTECSANSIGLCYNKMGQLRRIIGTPTLAFQSGVKSLDSTQVWIQGAIRLRCRRGHVTTTLLWYSFFSILNWVFKSRGNDDWLMRYIHYYC